MPVIQAGKNTHVILSFIKPDGSSCIQDFLLNNRNNAFKSLLITNAFQPKCPFPAQHIHTGVTILMELMCVWNKECSCIAKHIHHVTALGYAVHVRDENSLDAQSGH
jgi:HKD family nuclease